MLPHWAQALPPARIKKTSADQLAYLFDELCSTDKYRTNATKLAEKFSEEDGITTAINLNSRIESFPQKMATTS